MKKLQKLNLKKIRIASINTMYTLKGGFTVENCASNPCETDNCASQDTQCPSDTITGYDCTITVNNIPDTQRCQTTLPSKVKN